MRKLRKDKCNLPPVKVLNQDLTDEEVLNQDLTGRAEMAE